MEILTSKEELDEAKALVASLYKNEEGGPFVMTDGQAELFLEIFKKKHPRVHIQTTTQYGKSEVVSMAVLTRATTVTEQWIITAGSKEKAGIIMDYVIRHIFDNEYTKSKFKLEKGENEERIRRYRNKSKINFKLEDGTLSEIMITSAENALGYGAPNVVEDESALIPDNYHSLVMRMLGAQTDNFMCKIGNPFESDHFRASSEDPKYHKIIIDYHQAIKEGRLTQDFIEEMRKLPNFRVLYEVKFPPRDQIDEKGWVPLLIKDDIDKAMVDANTTEGFGIHRMGVDVAGGGRNYSVMVNRWTNIAKLTYKLNESDTMSLTEAIVNNQKLYNLANEDIFIDKVGIGRGVYDMARRLIPGAVGINAGETPIGDQDKEVYYNLRAQMYWKLREWILAGGKLEYSEDWYQLTKIKYRTVIEGTKRGKIQIMSKEDMLKEGVMSPDVADAIALTFSRPDIIKPNKNEDMFFRAKMLLKGKSKKNKGDAYNVKMTNY